MERYFDLVDDNGLHVIKDVPFPSLAQAYESYFKLHPEGLPKGWRIVDTSKSTIEKYVSAIKKIKPSFRKSDIEVHYDVLPDGLPQTGELCMVALGFQLNEDGSMKFIYIKDQIGGFGVHLVS